MLDVVRQDLRSDGVERIARLALARRHVDAHAMGPRTAGTSIRPAKAISDQGLNNVLIEYFRGAANIASTFQPSALMPGDLPDTIVSRVWKSSIWSASSSISCFRGAGAHHRRRLRRPDRRDALRGRG
jgi:hypothetical protein